MKKMNTLMTEQEFEDWYLFAQNCWGVLRGTLQGLNLIGHKYFTEFFFKQILDSVLPLYLEKSKFVEIIHKNKEAIYFDVGFGGGFPLLPLAHYLQKSGFKSQMGVESKRKKIEGVKKIEESLKLKHPLMLLNNSIKEITIDHQAILTFKAVGAFYDLLLQIYIAKNLKNSVNVLFYKGGQFFQKEDEQIKQMEKEKIWKMDHIEKYFIPSFDLSSIEEYEKMDVKELYKFTFNSEIVEERYLLFCSLNKELPFRKNALVKLSNFI